MIHLRRSFVVLSAFTLVTVQLSGCAGKAGSTSSQSMPEMENVITHKVTENDLALAKSAAPIESDSAVLWVNGLGCPLCATNIDKQLERVRGVERVDVDLSNGKVTLKLKPGAAHPSPSVLGEAIEDAGFTLVKVEKR